MNATVLFWILFMLINAYYFIPRYLLEVFHTQFFPLKFFAQGKLSQRLRHFLIRRNYDLFRISIDFFVLAVLYPLLLKEYFAVLSYAIFLALYFWLSLLYQVYYHAFHKIYQLDPVFFHDFLMLKTAVQIFIHEYSLKNFLMTIGAAMIAGSAAILIYLLVSIGQNVVFGTGSYLFVAVVSLGALYSMWHYPYAKYPQLTFQSQLQSFIRNILASGRSKQSLARLTLKYMKQWNVAPDIKLSARPNIYFIVIESYGKVALQNGAFRDQFDRYAPPLEKSLHQNGWQVRSAYTTAPVTGGASWISYTSMLYGLNVRNQGVYLTMLKNKYMAEYDSLFHWLKRQGYTTFRISSLGGYEKMEIPYDSYSRLYGIDHWVKYKDLEYTGEHYGFGPSPPDQYAIWRGEELTTKIAGSSPKATFFISQNSHTPYDSPTDVVEDWQSLNTANEVEKKPSAFWSRPKFEKYADAIEYQLRYLTDFIIRKGTEQDIFILIGDHQPPSVSIAMESFDTPMHVVAKDPRFAETWRQYGFVEGFIPDEKTAPIKQEALHWAFLRSLIKTYSSDQSHLPEFLPEGIPY